MGWWHHIPVMPTEEIVLDVNVLAGIKTTITTGTVKHSPSHKLLAYSTDLKEVKRVSCTSRFSTWRDCGSRPCFEMDGMKLGCGRHTFYPQDGRRTVPINSCVAKSVATTTH
jgi:hypothetical protein